MSIIIVPVSQYPIMVRYYETQYAIPKIKMLHNLSCLKTRLISYITSLSSEWCILVYIRDSELFTLQGKIRLQFLGEYDSWQNNLSCALARQSVEERWGALVRWWGALIWWGVSEISLMVGFYSVSFFRGFHMVGLSVCGWVGGGGEVGELGA